MLSTPPFLYSSLMSSSDDEDYNRGGELEEELSDDLSDAEVMAGDADMPAARPKGPLCPAGPLSKQAKMRARLRFLGRAHLYAARPDRDPFFVAILLPSGRFQYAGDPGLIGALRDVAPTLKAAQAVYSHEQRVTQSTAVCARDTFLSLQKKIAFCRHCLKKLRRETELLPYGHAAGRWPARLQLSGVPFRNPGEIGAHDVCEGAASSEGEPVKQIDALFDALAAHVPGCAAQHELAELTGCAPHSSVNCRTRA